MKFIKLDFIRAFASIYVFAAHFMLIYLNQLPTYISKFFLFGAEAVTAFFLLSGFVIYYSYVRKQESFKHYFIKRFRRIYPLLLVAISLSLICLYLTHKLHHTSIKEILANIFMFQNQEIFKGFLFAPIYNNAPLWSLAYEWWYYMLFIPTFILCKKVKLNAFYVSAAISFLCTVLYYLSYNFICLIGMYYIIWYAGAELARIYLLDKKILYSNANHIFWCLMFISFVHLYFIYNEMLSGAGTSLMKYPFIMVRFPLFAAMCILFIIYLNRFFSLIISYIPSKWIEKIASISFGIYIFHFPIILLPDYFGILILNILYKTILVLILAFWGERVFQPSINKIIPV